MQAVEELESSVEDEKSSLVYNKLFKPKVERERDYKIDPFHVSPHKYSIQLFISTKKDHFELSSQKYSSSKQLDTDSSHEFDFNESSLIKRWNSYDETEESLFTPKRVLMEKNIISTSEDKLKTENENNEKFINTSKVNHSVNTSDKKVKGILKKNWSSFNVKSSLKHSLIYKHSKSFDLAEARDLLKSRGYVVDTSSPLSDISHNISNFHNISNNSIKDSQFSLSSDKPDITGLSEAEKLILETSIKDKLDSISHSRKESIKRQVNLLKFSADSQIREVDDLLTESDSEDKIIEEEETDLDKEENKYNLEPYGCLITIESRSTSMDDIGNSQAFEDVLVSLTSNEDKSMINNENNENKSVDNYTGDNNKPEQTGKEIGYKTKSNTEASIGGSVPF